jgi:hypothetical protein
LKALQDIDWKCKAYTSYLKESSGEFYTIPLSLVLPGQLIQSLWRGGPGIKRFKTHPQMIVLCSQDWECWPKTSRDLRAHNICALTLILCQNCLEELKKADFGIKSTWGLKTSFINEILSFVSKWMELENIILSEVSQAQKTKNPMFSLICRL